MAEIASISAKIEEVTSSAAPDTIAQAQQLLLEYGRFVKSQPGAARFCFGSLEKEAERLPASYLEQDGGCLLARVEGVPVGFIAWSARPLSVAVPNAWEMKRLWVRPEARGLRLGAALTEAVLDRARTAERQAIYLETEPEAMSSAHRMYLTLGFVPCTSPEDNSADGIVCLVKHL
jgi:putative acetyltransferase